ncbi:MAG TPA: sulfurtransferase TusA family protein, partial [Methylomirabilota bacterium]
SVRATASFLRRRWPATTRSWEPSAGMAIHYSCCPRWLSMSEFSATYMRIVADHKLDCLGLFCPMPVLKTRDAMKQMAVGQVLEMTSDDPASEADMTSWVARTGHELLEIERDGAVYRFLLRKTR